MLEAGDYVVSDDIGTVYRLDALLNVKLLTRLQEPVKILSWSETGEFGTALVGKNSIVRIDARLKVVWTIEVPFTCTTLAIDPYGVFTFLASADGGVLVLDDRGKKAAVIETVRPLSHVGFLIDEPVVFAAAEHGLLATYSIAGRKVWEQPLWSNVGDLAVVQKTGHVLLATLNQGIQAFNGQGDAAGSFILEGTVSKVATNYSGNHSLAATIENSIYRLDDDGSLLWAAPTEEEIVKVDVHPIDPVGLIVLKNHQVLRLEWS